jgi:hypothetical protein
MTAITANARYFLQNTDYPADQVVYLTSGSYVIPGTSTGNIQTIPHGLPFIPLVGGNFSLTSDFSLTYEYSTGPLTSPINPNAVYDVVANVYADATNVYVSADTPSVGSKTIYYRIYGFQPSTNTSSLTNIANQGDVFVLQTDYNLTKLYLNDTVQLPDTSGAAAQVNIYHGLGYIPQAQVWIQANGYVHPAPSSNLLASQTVISPGLTNLSFGIPIGDLTHQAWYRIYVDD